MALIRFKHAKNKPTLDLSKALRILYVEDEDANWEVTALAFRGKYLLKRAKNAREAFDILRAQRFDLILMDIQLAGSDLNGIEITEILSGKFSGDVPDYVQGTDAQNIPIVFVSAYSARYERKELIAAGADDFVTKPVDMTRLNLLIARLLMRAV